MSSQAQMEKMQLRQSYRNVWHSDLISTMTADAPYSVHSDCSAPCASYMLRKRALYNDMSRYVCCGGYLPCSGRCGESKCPEFCLCTEVFICFANSVASTRFLLQDQFNIQTTKCDNCIIAFMVCLQQLACIFSLVAMIVGSDEISEASQILNCLSDMVYCTVCACMQTQHKIEMDKRDGRFGPTPMAVPPPQQMSRVDQPYPPTAVGHPQGYGQSPYGYPQGQPQGYPPQGYPPQGYNSQFQPQGYPPQGSPHQGYNYQYQPQGYPPQGSPHQVHQPQGAQYQGYPPQGYPPQGHPPQSQSHSHPPQGETQNHPPQGQPQGSEPQGQPTQPQAHPSTGHPPSSNPSSGH
ncbi:Keratin-associated protein like [Heracleum sosnowskyi]|uniref:Rhodopsin n=1 Tax=Heracleum sosnowskyi TaxID=360622 RepID=A0AAD8GPT3_9APIA|nr:Keratin-associated protein like [Heracleum sosnowskyi]